MSNTEVVETGTVERRVTLSVPVMSDGQVAHVYDVIARAAAGLVMDGLEPSIYTFTEGADDE